MNMQKNFGFKMFFKAASNVARQTALGACRNQVSAAGHSCDNVAQCRLTMMLSLHRVPVPCPNGILKSSKEKALDGIHPSKSAAK
jgi:hypothetical protein